VIGAQLLSRAAYATRAQRGGPRAMSRARSWTGSTRAGRAVPHPDVSVDGTNGKTNHGRMISHILRQAGLRVGMATTDGVVLRGA